jgi:mono/diheme cytochrome c family protein
VRSEDAPKLKDNSKVSQVLFKLGDDPGWYPDYKIKNASSKAGEEIFTKGFATKPKGGSTKIQSKHFVCTSCHNIEREDPDLTVSDPQARLDYTMEKGIPFLQGTSLYGAVSRRTFYNDDYVLKYGELVEPARNDLRGAIQLCAVECAQGRELNEWELESILMYLWTIDLTIGDLGLTNDEKAKIEELLIDEPESAASLIKSKYLLGSPATFVKPDKERDEYNKMVADVANGENIYLNSCLHCHENGRYSYFALDTSKLSMKFLQRKSTTYTDHSIYQAVRYGIYSTSGRRSYMPQYPLEKMSEEQLLDLRGYIDYKASE